MADVSILEVFLGHRKIGTLTLLPGDQTLFSFDPDYIDDPDRPVLSLSFKDVLGELITHVRPVRTRVPPFFSNLLPEGTLREYLAKKAGVDPKREFFLLRVLGCDLPGAVSIKAANPPAFQSEAKNMLQTDLQRNETILRFSLAGIQLKFSAVMETAGGLTIPAEGVGGSWIVKLPSMKFDKVPENEYAMMKLARTIGIRVPEVRLLPPEKIAGLPEDISTRMDGNVLAVKRFDRTDSGDPVHIEDFAQVFGLYPEKKYDQAGYRNIAEVIWAECGAGGISEFIRRLVFNTLIGNADMHLKNWSLIYPDGRQAFLTPGYDFVSTIAYLPDTDMALKFGRSRAMTALSSDLLSYFASKARLPRKLVLDTANETADKFIEIWKDGQAIQDICPKVISPINELLRKTPLVNELV